MKDWKDNLKFDPLTPLCSVKNSAILYFVNRDLLEKKVESVENLWNLPEVEKIFKKQQQDGSWKYPSSKEDFRVQENYNQIETFRQLGELIEKYGLTNRHYFIENAAEFLFSFQTEEGDIRGIYGNQYSPNYTAAIIEILVKAGYTDDPRIEKGFKWLLSCRQDDGGWAIPIRTNNAKWDGVMNSEETLQPNRSKPFSHMVTGVILRAFAAHPEYQKYKEAKIAGELLASRFFKPDKYPDRRTRDFWTKVSFPFWFTDIVSSLDTLFYLGFNYNYPQIKESLNFLRDRQLDNGLWDLKLLRTKDKDLTFWVALSVCKIFKNYFS
ncbi:MAG: prenyltransferase/squalene oxidase repeat-containing protein [Candidatus Hodarchaeota archaeon]